MVSRRLTCALPRQSFAICLSEPHDGELDLGELDGADDEPDLGWTNEEQLFGAPGDLTEQSVLVRPARRARPRLNDSPEWLAKQERQRLNRILAGEPAGQVPVGCNVGPLAEATENIRLLDFNGGRS
jgi:hypothetical protein